MKHQAKNVVKLIGYASGVAANNIDCALGPWYLFYHPALFHDVGMDVDWQIIIKAASMSRGMDVMSLVKETVYELGKAVMPSAQLQQPFCVFGGDHSSAIGTWSAVANAYRDRGDIGLIWIDAHMDSHTPITSETQNIHGMPLAHLLGEGRREFIDLFDEYPALKPENICLIGIRSYEAGEEAILTRLGVKVIHMDEIKQRGIQMVLGDAKRHVLKATCGFGISLDLDGIDPNDAPGVGCPEPDGIGGHELVCALQELVSNQSILGLEIVEYNPIRDPNHKTAKLAVKLLHAVYG
ncbi:MAG: arginase [Legionellaceae bacterium]|nr:arginase [Legionellaceae bacterium]